MDHILVTFKTEYKGGVLTSLVPQGTVSIPLALQFSVRHDVTIPIALYPGWDLVISIRPRLAQ